MLLWEASTCPSQRSVETPVTAETAAQGSRAAAKANEGPFTFLCLTYTVPERNGSFQTKINKLEIWIWTLDFNHLVAAGLQVAGVFYTDWR